MSNLKNFPKVYYINLDHRYDRRKFMEDQFLKYEIDCSRVSGSKYLGKEIDKWKDQIVDSESEIFLVGTPGEIGTTLSHLETIFTWVEESTDPYLCIMEDDCDLSMSDYWNFSWEDIFQNLPTDWDCIQLCVDSDTELKFYLHPFLPHSGSVSAYIITRHYAEKLKKIHHLNGKFKLRTLVNDLSLQHLSGYIEYIIYDTGKSYSFPLLTINDNLNSDHQKELSNNKNKINPRHLVSNRHIEDWWKNKSKNYYKNDYLFYNKKNDSEMNVVFKNQKISYI